MNPACVGQSPWDCEWRASVPAIRPSSARKSKASAEVSALGRLSPCSRDFVPGQNTALDACFGLLQFGGAGHTAVIYSRTIRAFASTARACQRAVLVGTPAPQEFDGHHYQVFPAMTLGCGAMAGNSTSSDNVGPQH